MDNGFYQKNGYAIRIIARDFLVMEDGSRIPSIEVYTKRLSVSRWVVQVALNFLEENGAVRLEKRGVLGTFMHLLDENLLWEYADLNPLLGILPFPSTEMQAGLITGINESFSGLNTPLLTAYLPSSGARFKYLEKGSCHFMVTTELAAKQYMVTHPEFEIAMDIPDARYCDPYVLISRVDTESGLKDGMTIAIHDDSIEQKFLAVEMKKTMEITYTMGSYHEQLQWFEQGEIDGLITRSDRDLEIFTKKGYKVVSLAFLGFDESSVKPVVVVKQDALHIKEIIEKNLNVRDVAAIQEEVLEKKRPAKYL